MKVREPGMGQIVKENVNIKTSVTCSACAYYFFNLYKIKKNLLVNWVKKAEIRLKGKFYNFIVEL